MLTTLPTELWALLAILAIVSRDIAVEIIHALAAIIRDLITRHREQQD